MGERDGNLVEGQGAVDVDSDLAADTELGERLEVGRTLLHSEHPHRATGDPADDPSDAEHAQ
jgi:hypothetical protein